MAICLWIRPDKISSFKKGCVRTDGHRVLLYHFPHESFIINFHSLSLLLSENHALYIVVKSLAR
jgi:hypothetical protein